MSFLDVLLRPDRKASYSQCGEDLIVDFIFSARPPRNHFFIDIGAHHPTYLNNTYLFYLRGWRGVNVDPLPDCIAAFEKKRRRDINVHAGIGTDQGTSQLYVLDASTLSTFDKSVVDRYVAMGHQLKRVEQVPFLSVAQLISKYDLPRQVALLSIDIEGNELQVVEDFVANGVIPNVLICETVHYSPTLPRAQKNHRSISAIGELGYVLYADTFVNSIFVSKDFWKA